jgi:hydroxyethylthiazole kinase
VHNITNFVAMNPMANILLAAGASPAMVHAVEESAEFALLADALTVNIGTLSPIWVEGMLAAARAASQAGKPWVLDPVAAGATSLRRDAAARLLALRPTVVRGNASEIIALAGDNKAGKGVDAADPVAAAEDAARSLAERSGAVVAVTGEIDYVTDGRQAARIANGHPMMPQVTALGCSLTGVIGAFLGAGCTAFDGTVSALAYYGLAGERAAVGAEGPASFAIYFVDALATMSTQELDDDARIAPFDLPDDDALEGPA